MVEFDDDVLAYTVDPPIPPQLQGIVDCAAAFGSGPDIAAVGMRVHLVGRAVNNVDAAAIRFPSGNARTEVLVAKAMRR